MNLNNQDSYVIIHEENVKEGKMKNFKLRQFYKPSSPYDYYSIMHYGAYFFSKDKVWFREIYCLKIWPLSLSLLLRKPNQQSQKPTVNLYHVRGNEKRWQDWTFWKSIYCTYKDQSLKSQKMVKNTVLLMRVKIVGTLVVATQIAHGVDLAVNAVKKA